MAATTVVAGQKAMIGTWWGLVLVSGLYVLETASI